MNIKKLLIGGLMFMLAHTGLYAISDEELYLQGNSFYLQGDYTKALARYQDIKRKGPAVFHNMGNCYSYLSNPVDAIVSWRQAQKGAGYAEFDQLDRAIQSVKQAYYEQESIEHLNSTQENNKLERLFVPYSLLWVQIIFLLFWYLFFLLFFVRHKQRKKRSIFSGGSARFSGENESRLRLGSAGQSASLVTSWFTSLLYLCILGSMIFLGIGMWLKNKEHTYKRAVVAQTEAALHAGPQKKFQRIAELDFLDELLVEESSKGWCKVREERKACEEKKVREEKKVVDKKTDWPKTGWLEEANIKIIN